MSYRYRRCSAIVELNESDVAIGIVGSEYRSLLPADQRGHRLLMQYLKPEGGGDAHRRVDVHPVIAVATPRIGSVRSDDDKLAGATHIDGSDGDRATPVAREVSPDHRRRQETNRGDKAEKELLHDELLGDENQRMGMSQSIRGTTSNISSSEQLLLSCFSDTAPPVSAQIVKL